MGHSQTAGVTLAFLLARSQRTWLPGACAKEPPVCPAGRQKSVSYPVENIFSNPPFEFGPRKPNETSLSAHSPNGPYCALGMFSEGCGSPPLQPPLQDGPQLFAMNVTFILLGCVQSQVRLLQIEYRNIHFSFQKGLLNVKSN